MYQNYRAYQHEMDQFFSLTLTLSEFQLNATEAPFNLSQSDLFLWLLSNPEVLPNELTKFAVEREGRKRRNVCSDAPPEVAETEDDPSVEFGTKKKKKKKTSVNPQSPPEVAEEVEVEDSDDAADEEEQKQASQFLDSCESNDVDPNLFQ